MQAIGRCTWLLLVDIHGFGVVTDAGLAALSPLRRLVSLHITGARSFADVTEEALAAAVGALPDLLYLDIYAPKLDQPVSVSSCLFAHRVHTHVPAEHPAIPHMKLSQVMVCVYSVCKH